MATLPPGTKVETDVDLAKGSSSGELAAPIISDEISGTPTANGGTVVIGVVTGPVQYWG